MRSSTTDTGSGEAPSESVTSAIVQQVATATDTEVTQLPSLYDRIDPDALEAIVESTGASATSLSIAFEYAGHHVTVTGDGTVHVGSAET
jgi:hypothetical protein